jgi:hypothetical protein
MDNFVLYTIEEKLEVLQESSNEMQLNPIILEKDFWVCWILRALYSIQEFSSNITFKGGTSLSKAYGLIKRFSEDCDLTIAKLVFEPYKDPSEEGISGKEQARRIESLVKRVEEYIKEIILLKLNQTISKSISEDEFKLTLDKNDPQTILFSYPSCFSYKEDDDAYIKPIVRLEFGARGGIIPKENKIIKPYIADIIPNIFTNSEVVVPVLSAERTFWEKITILHSLYHKNLKGKRFNDRMSRHYYDIFMMIGSGLAEKAINQKGLLSEVTKNNMIFFKDNNASYETSKIGSLKLVPEQEMQNDLKRDYLAMNEMFMHDQIPFEQIIESISELEAKINTLK